MARLLGELVHDFRCQCLMYLLFVPVNIRLVQAFPGSIVTGVARRSMMMCKQVYEATGWSQEADISLLYKYWDDYDELCVISIDDADDELVPAYTSDYLLEKLPKKIKRDSSTGWLVLSPMDSQGAWSVGYEPDHTEHIDDYPMEWGESPVAALLRLTLKLHEEEIL